MSIKVNGKLYKNLKEALPDIQQQYPFMSLERLQNIQAGRPDRLSGSVVISQEAKGRSSKADQLGKLLKILKDESPETHAVVQRYLARMAN